MNRRIAQSQDNEVEATSVRPQRIAVGLRPKLSLIGKNPNFEYRFVNDTPGRIAMFKQSGWELCTNAEVDTGNFRAEDTTELGSLAYTVVDGGTGMKAYAMKIKKEWYNAFMDEYAAEVDRTEETLHPDTNDGGYGKLTIDRSGRR